MKQKAFTLVVSTVLLAQAWAISENPAKKKNNPSTYALISRPENSIKLNQSVNPKRKILRFDNARTNRFAYIMEILGSKIKNSLLSALKPLSSKASYIDQNDLNEEKHSRLFSSSGSLINELPSELQKNLSPFRLNTTSSKNTIMPQSSSSGRLLSINKTRPSIIPYGGNVAEIIVDQSQDKEISDLERGFYHQFEKYAGKINDPKKFVKKGIQNAKRNLMSQARLARAFTTAAANKTIGMFENTLRSSHLLSDLVKKGLITPRSAAKELASSVKDVSSDFMDTGSRSMKGASTYLLKTASESVDGIINGLKYSPSAMQGLLNSYKNILENPKFNFHHEFPSLAISLEMDMYKLKELLHPHTKKPMGAIRETMLETIKILKKQWSKIENSLFDGHSLKYKEKFLSLTEDLSRTLDALRTRLGKGAQLQVPGINALKNRFKIILDELKKKNHLTISGTFSFSELLEYSLGTFSQLKEIDRAILGIAPKLSQIKNSMSSKNPLEPLTGFNLVGKGAFNELKAFSGFTSQKYNTGCIANNCLKNSKI